MKTFKKFLSGIVALSLCMSSSAVTAGALTTTYHKGDVDGNNVLNLIDLTYLRNFISGNRGSVNNRLTQRLDVNLDGVISERDVEELSEILLNDDSTTLYNYETVSNDVPQSTNMSYQKYNAQTGASIGTAYTLQHVNSVPDYSSTYNIIGNDTREIDYYNPSVVKINSSVGTFTGFIVDSHTILTAAHCLVDKQTGELASNLSYTLYAFNGSVVWSAKSAVNYHIPINFIQSNYSSNYDYALITVAEDLSNKISFDLGVARKSLNNKNEDIYVTGYSNEENPNRPELTNEIVTGSGKLYSNKVTANLIYYNTDAAEGESGAPVYVVSADGKKTVIGIHGSYSPSVSSNYCKRIDTNVLQFVFNNPNL